MGNGMVFPPTIDEQWALLKHTHTLHISPCGNASQIFDLTDPYNFIRLDAFVTSSLILFYSFSTDYTFVKVIVLTALHIYDLTDPHNFIRLD